MRFLEVKEGFSINRKSIEAIERKDEFTSTVHTRFNSYTANFPYITLLQILDMEEHEEKPKDMNNETMKKLDAVLNSAQHFAG